MPPVAPSGWPIAIAPPLTFTFSRSRSRSRTKPQDHRRERLVDLDEIEVARREAGLLERLARGGRGPVSMIVGSAPETAVARIRARGRSPWRSPAAPFPIITSEAPSTMPDELPPVCTWSMRSIQWYFLQRDGVEAAGLADHVEGGAQLAERLGGRPRRTCSSWSSRVRTVLIDHRHDRLLEAPGVLGCGGALLAADGVRVAVLAREALDGGDEVGADALRHECGVHVRLGVHRPGATVAAHRHAAHGFHAAGEDQVPPSHLRPSAPRDVHGLEARGAEPVELHAGHGVRQAGLERRGLGDVHALVADRAHAAEHDIVRSVRIKARVAARASRRSGRRRGRPA